MPSATHAIAISNACFFTAGVRQLAVVEDHIGPITGSQHQVELLIGIAVGRNDFPVDVEVLQQVDILTGSDGGGGSVVQTDEA